MKDEISFQVINDSSETTAIGSAGMPVVIYGFNFVGDSFEGTTVTVLAGPTQPEVSAAHVDVDAIKTITLPGVVFPNGCYVGTGIAQRLTVFYEKV